MTAMDERCQVGSPLDRLVREALDDALWSLGEPVAKTLVWHLQSRGFTFDRTKPFDLDGLDTGLKQILGISENRVMIALFKKLSLHCKMADVLQIEALSTRSTRDKVCKLLGVMRRDGVGK